MVDSVTGTVINVTGRLGILGNDGDLYWVDLSERKDIAKEKFYDGQIVIVYYQKSLVRQVNSVVPFFDENDNEVNVKSIAQ